MCICVCVCVTWYRWWLGEVSGELSDLYGGGIREKKTKKLFSSRKSRKRFSTAVIHWRLSCTRPTTPLTPAPKSATVTCAHWVARGDDFPKPILINSHDIRPPPPLPIWRKSLNDLNERWVLGNEKGLLNGKYTYIHGRKDEGRRVVVSRGMRGRDTCAFNIEFLYALWNFARVSPPLN